MNEDNKAVLCIICDSDTKIWHQTPAERLKRAFARTGITKTITVAELATYKGPVILLRGDALLDAPLVAALPHSPGTVLLTNENKPLGAHAPAGQAEEALKILKGEQSTAENSKLKPVSAKDLAGSYWHALRKREEPYALLLSKETLKQTEWRMFMGTYKGATDLVTKWVWPRPAFHATKFCAALGITPNMVTWLSLLLVILAFWLFLEGAFLWGLLAGWGMTFLDTVDGKLARITLTSSKLGNAFDHGIDLIHPPFWYIAWAIGLQSSAFPLEETPLYASLAVILSGYVLQRLLEGLSIWLFKLEIHVWRPVDTYFRQITARRNPNMLLLTLFTLLGRPDWGLLAVAIWTALCLVLHLLQFLQAWFICRRGGTLSSWLTETADK